MIVTSEIPDVRLNLISKVSKKKEKKTLPIDVSCLNDLTINGFPEARRGAQLAINSSDINSSCCYEACHDLNRRDNQLRAQSTF